MKELPTLQEVIVRRATRKLEDDIASFRCAIQTACAKNSSFESIARTVEFPFANDLDRNTASIQYLFCKAIVVDKVKEKLLPWYVDKEVNNMVEAIDRIPKVDEPEPCRD